MIQAQPSSVRDPAEFGRVAVKLFLGIAEQWGLSEKERLTLSGSTSRTTLNNWRRAVAAGQGVRLGPDTLERLSYLAGIYKALELLLPTPAAGRDWLRRPNADFGGQPPLARMLAGRVVDLADVRRHLDGWRGDQHV